MKNEKGITLVALVITVIMLIIISAMSIEIGTESIENTRLKALYTQLEIIQKRVDSIASIDETYYNEYGEQIKLKETGTAYEDMDYALQGILDTILAEYNVNMAEYDFRYFTKEDLENILDISEAGYDVYIDFEHRIVIAKDGVVNDGVEHHILENTTFFIKQDITKNLGEITLEYNVSKIGEQRWKVKVTPSTVGDVKATGTLKYKKPTTRYFETADGLEFIINSLTEYNIKYEDANKNSVEETIEIKRIENINSSGVNETTYEVVKK